tara:strand:- start:2864 stop:3577 length:714 start_codon:yes stop_codon:yes gene_type:complete
MEGGICAWDVGLLFICLCFKHNVLFFFTSNVSVIKALRGYIEMKEYKLHLAIVEGDLNEVRRLLKNKNAPINSCGRSKKYSNYNPLYLAIILKHTDIFHELLRTPNIDVNSCIGGSSLTILLRLAGSYAKFKNEIQLLLSMPNIDVNYVDRYGRTAYEQTDDVDFKDMLVKKGAVPVTGRIHKNTMRVAARKLAASWLIYNSLNQDCWTKIERFLNEPILKQGILHPCKFTPPPKWN